MRFDSSISRRHWQKFYGDTQKGWISANSLKALQEAGNREGNGVDILLRRVGVGVVPESILPLSSTERQVRSGLGSIKGLLGGMIGGVLGAPEVSGWQ